MKSSASTKAIGLIVTKWLADWARARTVDLGVMNHHPLLFDSSGGALSFGFCLSAGGYGWFPKYPVPSPKLSD
jgi:hypothetical protein